MLLWNLQFVGENYSFVYKTMQKLTGLYSNKDMDR